MVLAIGVTTHYRGMHVVLLLQQLGILLRCYVLIVKHIDRYPSVQLISLASSGEAGSCLISTINYLFSL